MGPSRRGHVEQLAGNLLKLARLERDVSQSRDRIGYSATLAAPRLVHILAAIDQELRIQLAPYDSHDEIIDVTEQRLSADEQAHRAAIQDQFATQLRQGTILEPR